MPGGNAFISPRETWNMRNEGANCVAQTIFLASMMGCLRGAKKGKPPCTYLVAFKSQVKGTCGHSVLAVLINKDLHERDAKKAGRNVEGIHYLDPPESMGGTSSHVGNRWGFSVRMHVRSCCSVFIYDHNFHPLLPLSASYKYSTLWPRTLRPGATFQR
jgi:hypothetical protein